MPLWTYPAVQVADHERLLAHRLIRFRQARLQLGPVRTRMHPGMRESEHGGPPRKGSVRHVRIGAHTVVVGAPERLHLLLLKLASRLVLQLVNACPRVVALARQLVLP